ncbi:conjugal transfer protein MobB [Alistipes finegoldii]|uniref:conjugal transfer protein MobB n=1 Tax=Alistipes finegoldii TaxID=214856 RepID=UPI00242FC3AF|nr:conjugal transfer protein MobB [Alistipes finegoldii]
MVAKINVGSSLYGALTYNGEKISEGQGRLLATHKIFDEGTGRLDIRQAAEDFARHLPEQVRTAKPVVHISLNPHPDDRLNDAELTAIAEEYLARLGYGDQPYAVFKHEDIDRHHLHIVTLCVDEAGRKIGDSFIRRRSKNITRALERQYGLHPAERKRQTQTEPLCAVDAAHGDVKRQIGNVLKGISGKYRFQTLGEYRALLSLYRLTVEECRGEVRGREYRGFVYSVIDDKGGKVGTPIKASRFGKRYGYEAFERWCAVSKEQIRERKLGDMIKATATAALHRTKDRAEFIGLMKAKGVDVVLRETDTGRIYGATFIDHRTGCVLNGSRLGKELSANALQEHFAPPAAGIPLPIVLSQQPDMENTPMQSPLYDDAEVGGLGLFSVDTQGTDAEEEAFMREMQRRKKKKKRNRKV